MAKDRDDPATIPADEQPHPIPGNWRWTKLDSVSVFERGITFPKSAKELSRRSGNIPCIRTANIQDSLDLKSLIYVDEALLKGNRKKLLEAGDILFSSANSRELVGKCVYVARTDFPMTFGGFTLNIRSAEGADNRFLFWYLRFQFLTGYFFAKATQTTNIANINSKILGNCPLPLPPLAEQRRIAERIESLFTKLDEAREKAQAVVDGYELRRAAILRKAFSGELTAQWRAESGISFSAWEDVPLESVCRSIFDGDHMPPPKAKSGIPFLVISNVNNGHLSYENTRFVSQEYYNSISETRKPQVGDLLYTLVGSYGIPVVVDDSRPFCFQRHMALLKLEKIDTYYLWYQLQSLKFYHMASEIATGSAQLTVPIKGLRKIPVTLPSAEEQKEIVRVLDSLLAKEEQTKSDAERVLESVGLMKKALLGRAFRGLLGTNRPQEPPPEIP